MNSPYTSSVSKPVMLLFVFLLTACGSGDIDDLLGVEPSKTVVKQGPILDDAGNYSGTINIKMIDQFPKISRDEVSEKTNIILQFIPRSNDGTPLTSDQIDISLEIDGEKVGDESQLQGTAKELEFDVNFGLVLDTSYSMIKRDALSTMLSAARQSIQTGKEIWSTKDSSFNFYTSWFNDSIYYSVDNENKQWEPEDIESIPAPGDSSNAATRLFAAVDYMVNRISAIPVNAADSNKPDDQNIILVFSDGKDNYSWFFNDIDNEAESNNTNSGAEFEKIGYKKTEITGLLNNIKSKSNIIVHVIGLGDSIDEENLKAIAEKGNGIYRKNPDTDGLEDLFARVVQEFTTVQTQGVKIPLEPGEYLFTLKVSNKSGNEFDEYTFGIKTGDEGTAIIPVNTQ